jgi:hypothetical protein
MYEFDARSTKKLGTSRQPAHSIDLSFTPDQVARANARQLHRRRRREPKTGKENQDFDEYRVQKDVTELRTAPCVLLLAPHLPIATTTQHEHSCRQLASLDIAWIWPGDGLEMAPWRWRPGTTTTTTTTSLRAT